jgi:hypothetical protein
LMGARFYNPVRGLFTSLDPVPGGNDTAYNYPGDPINSYDLDGRVSCQACGGGGKADGRYGYFFKYLIGRSNRSAAYIMRRIKKKFSKIFPVAGRCSGSDLTPGRSCRVAGDNKVQIASVGATHFKFQSDNSHTEGANTIIFQIVKSGSKIYLYVRAWGAGKNWNRGFFGRFVNNSFAYTLWAKFAGNIRTDMKCSHLRSRVLRCRR